MHVETVGSTGKLDNLAPQMAECGSKGVMILDAHVVCLLMVGCRLGGEGEEVLKKEGTSI